MNHTPAPWTIRTDSEDPQAINIRSESVPFVASVWGDGGPSFKQAANARLIAAAPDLLAALQNALDRFESIPAHQDEAGIYRHAAAIAKTAIAKAIGE